MNLSFLKICDLQQLAIPDPGLCQLSLGLGRGSGIATRLIDLEEPIIGPAIRGGALERALELILRLGKPAGLQQRGSERLAHRIVPVGWFRVWQGILDSRGFFETSNRDREIPLRLSNATFDHSARKAHHLLARNPRCLEQREIRRSLEGCDRVSLSRERRETSEQDLFRSRLDQIIDMKHALVKLARAIQIRLKSGSSRPTI